MTGFLLPTLLFLLWIIWGYNYLAMKEAMTYCDPVTFSTLRAGIASFFLLGLSWKMKVLRLPQNIPVVFLSGGMQIGFFLLLSSYALLYESCNTTVLLTFLSPFWIVLFETLILGKAVSREDLICFSIAFLGVLIITYGDMNFNFAITKLFPLFAGIVLAIGILASKRVVSSTQGDLLNICTWQMISGFIVILLMFLISGTPHLEIDLRFIFLLLFSSIFAGSIAWLIWLYLLKECSAFFTGMSLFMIPALSTFLAYFHFDEEILIAEITGGSFIVISLILTWAKQFYLNKRTSS